MKKILILVLAFAVISVVAAAQMRETRACMTLYRNFEESLKDDGVALIVFLPDTECDSPAKLLAEKYTSIKKSDDKFKRIKIFMIYMGSDNYKIYASVKQDLTYSRAPYVLAFRTGADTTPENLHTKTIKDFSGQTGVFDIKDNLETLAAQLN